MNEVTVTFPAIDEAAIAQLDETETLIAENEVALVRALREKYAGLARLNGNIRISYYWVGNQNWEDSEYGYLTGKDGGPVKGLLALDDFGKSHREEFSGASIGSRLYLTREGWVGITRTGHWSNWQNAPVWWTCDGTFADGREFEEAGEGGGIAALTDEQVAARYHVDAIVKTLGDSLKELAQKVPERLTRKRALAEGFARIAQALKTA